MSSDFSPHGSPGPGAETFVIDDRAVGALDICDTANDEK
jgi:hypothetical protein